MKNTIAGWWEEWRGAVGFVIAVAAIALGAILLFGDGEKSHVGCEIHISSKPATQQERTGR